MIRSYSPKGQSLVELIVAIAVIEIGIFSVWSLFLVNFNAEREAESRIVGVNLAREGVEVIKNIRDSNWLKNANNLLVDQAAGGIWPWDHNLQAGEYAVNYDSIAPDESDFSQLYINDDGFYSDIPLGQKSMFTRKVALKDICCNDADDDFRCDTDDFIVVAAQGSCPLKIGINVVSTVRWQISGKDRQASVEDNIFNWR